MICSICKKGETSVVDSRPTEDGTAIRRRRLCVCGARFTTFERVQFRELVVVKKMVENLPLTEINYLNLYILLLRKDQ
tara:strand:+ start:270 stop:503 length:234 start_codon:yes stop_codon:yes gene_type:complete